MLALILTFSAVGRALAWDSATIVSNGSTAQKLDIVFLGDGYTAAEMDLYHRDGERFADYLFTNGGPFADYKNFFNVHRVDVISNQSGVDNTCQGIFVDTALDTGYYPTDIDCRILYTYSNSKVYAAAVSAPAADAIIIITNSSLYGGAAGYGGYGVFYRGSDGPEVMVHELGHSLGFLADEYFTPGTTYTGIEPFERNATTNTNRATLKWNKWINPSTPVPSTAAAPDKPGLYQGCRYNQSGIYRPTYASKMQFLYAPYERVNYEAMLDRIMNFIPPDKTPPTSSLRVPGGCGGFTNSGKATIILDAADPESHIFAYHFSRNPQFTDTAWEPASNQPDFSKTISADLGAEDGLKSFYYAVQNGYKLITSGNCSLTLDTIVPAAPGKPEGPGPNSGTFALSWNSSTDEGSGVRHYEIYRSSNGGNDFCLVNFSDSSIYSEDQLSPGSYIYKIRSKDNAENFSPYSENSDPIVVNPPEIPASAVLVNIDTTTQGNWKGMYGSEGYVIAEDGASYPEYAQVSLNGESHYVWTKRTRDVRALEGIQCRRIASTWYSDGNFNLDVNLTDGAEHQVGLYVLDWDYNGRFERVDILDAQTDTLLDTVEVNEFFEGKYLVWNIRGHVKIVVTNLNPDANAVLSGIFFR